MEHLQAASLGLFFGKAHLQRHWQGDPHSVCLLPASVLNLLLNYRAKQCLIVVGGPTHQHPGAVGLCLHLNSPHSFGALPGAWSRVC